MLLSSDELTRQLTHEKALELLKKLQEPVNYELESLDPTLMNAALQQVPWLSNFIQNVEDSGSAIIKIGEHVIELPDAPSNQALGNLFHFGSVAIAVLDFIRIPIVYFAAYLLSQKIPISLDNNARWLYSAMLLSLIIVSLSVPVAAPIISFLVASVGIIVSSFLLGRTLYERYQYAQQRKSFIRQIESGLNEMESIQNRAKLMQEQLSNEYGRFHTLLDQITRLQSDTSRQDQLAQQKLNSLQSQLEITDSNILAIYQNLLSLQEYQSTQKKHIEALKTQVRDIDIKIKGVGLLRVTDKSIAIIVGSFTLIGLVLSLYVPPVGVLIISTAAIASGSYVLARILTPLVQIFWAWGKSKLFYFDEKPIKEKSQISDTPDFKKSNDSTLGVLKGLGEPNTNPSAGSSATPSSSAAGYSLNFRKDTKVRDHDRPEKKSRDSNHPKTS